jgi:hypothetical protein
VELRLHERLEPGLADGVVQQIDLRERRSVRAETSGGRRRRRTAATVNMAITELGYGFPDQGHVLFPQGARNFRSK